MPIPLQCFVYSRSLHQRWLPFLALDAGKPLTFPCALQPNTAALMLMDILGELALRKFISLAAAVGCMRAALVTTMTSLGASDLHTANFFCTWLREISITRLRGMQSDGSASTVDNQEEDPAACIDFYSTCGVSLADLLPLVQAPPTMNIHMTLDFIESRSCNAKACKMSQHLFQIDCTVMRQPAVVHEVNHMQGIACI